MLQTENRTAEFLTILNDDLKKCNALTSFGHHEPHLPTIFVISAPMSGSTLTSQILLHSNEFAGISNFVARFWDAPYVGALIEQIFSLQNGDMKSDFKSVHGQTEGFGGSHEFGNFWNKWFDFGHETHKVSEEDLLTIDQSSLKSSLARLETVYNKPLLFKNNTWCSFQSGWLSQVLPRSIFVVCERDPLYVAQWLMLTRRQVFNNDEIWWSMKPSNYQEIKNKNKWEQVLLQAYHCHKETIEAVSQIPQDRVIKADYKQICETPGELLQRVINKCNNFGAKIELGHVEFPQFKNTDSQILNDKDWEELNQTYKQLALK